MPDEVNELPVTMINGQLVNTQVYKRLREMGYSHAKAYEQAKFWVPKIEDFE